MTTTVSEFIKAKFNGRNLEPLGEGHHSEAYKFEMDGETFVLRTSPKQDHFQRDKFIAEHWPQLPVPEIKETGTMEDGAYYAVWEFIEGHVLASGWQFNPGVELKKVKPSFIENMINISSASVDLTSGYGKIMAGGTGQYDSWQTFLLGGFENPKVKQAIEVQVEAGRFDADLLAAAEYETRRLLSENPVYETRHLLHGDYQPHNVIVKDGMVAAVLDWGNAKYGDFAYDVMWYSMHGPEVASMDEITAAYEDSSLDTAGLETRLRLCKISILIAWAMFSNEIGNHDNAQSDQNRLRDLLST